MSHTSETDKRLAMRESFARVFAVLILLLAFYVVHRTLPYEIDYDSPGQMLYIGSLGGTVFGWVTAAAAFFFFIQATEKNQRDQRQGDAVPLVTLPPPTGDAKMTVEVASTQQAQEPKA